MGKTAKIKIVVPKGESKRDGLNFNALSSHERQLARNTFIYVDGVQLLCASFKRKGKNVLIEVLEGSFEIVEED